MSLATTPSVRDAARGGKYLTFFLGEEEYGVAVLKVQEIIGLQAITRVPRAPVFVRGVINLRGKVVPVVDLRERFGLPPADVGACADARQVARAEALRCIVVVQVALGAREAAGAGVANTAAWTPMGIVVDRVSEVAAVDDACVEDAPSFGAAVRTDFLLGLATGGPRVRMLLDIDRVLAPDEAEEVDGLARAGA